MDKINLEELSLKYSTDKNPNGHNYVKVYNKYFSQIRESVKTVLEIGTLSGESAHMFAEYFTNAKIYTIDNGSMPGINIQKIKEKIESERIQLYIGDQSDTKFLLSVVKDKEFDIIIDDGSHQADHQITSFKTLFPFLSKNGFYIVEDLHTAYYPNCGGKKFIEFVTDLIHSVNFEGRFKLDGKCSNDELIIESGEYQSIYEERIESIHFHTGLVIIKSR